MDFEFKIDRTTIDVTSPIVKGDTWSIPLTVDLKKLIVLQNITNIGIVSLNIKDIDRYSSLIVNTILAVSNVNFKLNNDDFVTIIAKRNDHDNYLMQDNKRVGSILNEVAVLNDENTNTEEYGTVEDKKYLEQMRGLVYSKF